MLNAFTGTNISAIRLGSSGVLNVAGGILIPVPLADPGGLIDAGGLFLRSLRAPRSVSSSARLPVTCTGKSVNLFVLPTGDILVNNFLSDVGGVDSGQTRLHSIRRRSV